MLDTRMATSLPEDVCIVASPAAIAELKGNATAKALADFDLTVLDPSVPLPVDVIRKAGVLVMEVDQADLTSLRRIDQVRTLRASLPLIVALRDASVMAVRTLIRQGVNDVCSLPFDFDELHSQLCDLSARLRNDTATLPLGGLIAVVRSTGGCGATTVSTHLASALGREGGGDRSCLIDLDIQFGNVATVLGLSSRTGVTDLLEAGSRLDAELLASATIESGRGFDVIAAPDAITPLESVDIDHLLHLLSIARRKYSAVLVDLPANWTNWALSVATAATDLLVVTDLTIAGLRQTKRRIELFESVGIAKDRIRIVVNRVEKRLFRTISLDEVAHTLGLPVYAALSAETGLVGAAQDQGLLSWEANRKSRFASDIARLAGQLAEGWRR